MQSVCYNCFRYVPDENVCPYCGYDARKDRGKYIVALKPGTPLANRYVVGRVLGQGGFGVTYVALDSQTRARVAIKEYLPMVKPRAGGGYGHPADISSTLPLSLTTALSSGSAPMSSTTITPSAPLCGLT